MSKQSEKPLLWTILGSLGWPFAWGMAACCTFYFLLKSQALHPALGPYGPLLERYFAGHWVEYVEVAMFCIGLAALVIKLTGVLTQFPLLDRIGLEAPRGTALTVDDATRQIDLLEEAPPRVRTSYLGRRLREALESVERNRSAAGLDDELKYLADLDSARAHEGYALVRIVIWATPMLGFLGTVIGITLALGELSPEALVKTPETAMEGLLAGLSVAFDTTAVALSLSIVLMFAQFLIDRIETQLLEAVETRAREELIGRFETLGASGDPHVASIERMSRSVVQSTERLVERQTELWQGTINAAHDRWGRLVNDAGGTLQSSLASALGESIRQHAEQLAEAHKTIAVDAAKSASRLHDALAENGKLMQAQQAEMIRQGEVMTRAVAATGEVVKLETALNENLRALAGSKNFEDTVMSLAAAIHLLNTRLGRTPAESRVTLDDPASQGRAA
ncbi:MAG: MotA/TolQ/ExbB proton channel family protein [Planctomycetes bacterium]|nr:MotA/TolQ/ExbB proton channel family protein [Planctomycetota bacterium]